MIPGTFRVSLLEKPDHLFAIVRPNQVWCAHITYLPLARGFVYLVAVIWRFVRGT